MQISKHSVFDEPQRTVPAPEETKDPSEAGKADTGFQIETLDIRNMDLETALLAVQTRRVNLLESQLKDQIEAVQKKNDQVTALNKAMSVLNGINARFDANAKPTDGRNLQGTELQDFNDALKAAGYGGMDIGGAIAKQDLDAKISTLKGNIDSLSNTQQMDMLRLQSLTNKRNEAFDVMTNFIKKMQESRSSIVGNTR